jgi:hypothetical protein
VGLERTSQGTTAPTTDTKWEKVPPVQQPGRETSDDDEEISAPVLKSIEAVPELSISSSPNLCKSYGKASIGTAHDVVGDRHINAGVGDAYGRPRAGRKWAESRSSLRHARKWLCQRACKHCRRGAHLGMLRNWNSLSESLPQDSITFKGVLLLGQRRRGGRYPLGVVEMTKTNLHRLQLDSRNSYS